MPAKKTARSEFNDSPPRAHRAVNVAREAALAFLEADTNGDGVLEWSEFLDAVARYPCRVANPGLASRRFIYDPHSDHFL